MGVEKFTTFSN